MNKPLPATSEASLINGCWFVSPLGARTVRAWGASASGLERIYVDEVVVSERRSASRISAHEFAVNNEHYSVTFNTSGKLRSELECTLAKSGVPQKTLVAVMDRSSAVVLPRLLLSALAGVLIAAAGAYFELPPAAVVASIVVVVLIQGMSRKLSGVKIVERDVPRDTAENGKSTTNWPRG